MIIKGSLLHSIPTVKHFGRKFSKSENAPKNWGFGGSGADSFKANDQAP